jgi:hypothetical protein
MTDLRRRTFGPHPTSQDWRAASKANIEQALAAEVVRRNPKLYAGYDEDSVKFVRNTMGTTKWDLLLAAEAYGLAPQGTYLYPDERKLHHAAKPREMGRHLSRSLGRKTKARLHATKSINPEYLRKTMVAAQRADDAWLRGGIDEMDAELKWLRRNDADPVIIGEFERLYHKQMRQVLPEQRLAR